MRAMEIFSNEPDVRIFSAGQPIFAEGERGDVMYAVLQGEVELRKAGRVLGTVRHGGIFGEMAIIDTKPRSAAAVAKSDCRVAAIGQKRFSRLVEQTPNFALSLMQVLSDRLGRDLVT